MSKKIAPREYAKAFIEATVDASRDEIRKRAEVLYTLLKRDHNESIFSQIIEEAEKYLHDEGMTNVLVQTTTPLTPTQKKTLSAALEKDADNIRWQERIDPTIGAGIRMQIGDTVIDATMHGRLEQLRKALLSR